MADPLPPEFRNTVILECKAKVGGEDLVVRVQVVEAIMSDRQALDAIRTSLRQELMTKILERWTPVIRVQRGGGPLGLYP